MADTYYKLPPNLATDIDDFEKNVEQFLAGALPSENMKAQRVPRGIYEQRQPCTYMMRVRIAGGVVAPSQARGLAELADEYGNGSLHVTTRQDIQLHDIDLEDTPAVMRSLLKHGLTTKGGGGNTVRNVAACPYAGICPHECFDVTPFAHAVTEYLIAQTGSYNLPRKYKIAFSGCAADCALGQVTDLGFIAAVRDGNPGFRVFAGGGMGANSRVADELLDWVPAADIIRVSEAIRRLFDRLGDRSNRKRARLRYVLEKMGIQNFRRAFMETMHEVESDEVPLWQDTIQLNKKQETPDAASPKLEYHDNNFRVLRQRQVGLSAVPVHLPFGFVDANTFIKIADTAARFSNEKGLRTTRHQNLVIQSVPCENLPDLAAELQAVEADLLNPPALARFVSCAGAATCRLGLCLSRGAARACAEKLDTSDIGQRTLDNLDIYLNGCPNSCGHQPVGAIGLAGGAQRVEGKLVPTYQISLGGRCNAEGPRLGAKCGRIPAKSLPAALAALAKDYRDNRQRHELFNHYCDRIGIKHFKSVIDKFTGVPSYNEAPGFYRDFGADHDFSLAGRSAGECGSGVFQVIQKDLERARRTEDIFDKVLYTARALLITRGVDTPDPETVFREFETHFINTKLVAPELRSIVTRARAKAQGGETALEGCEEDAARLLERIDSLSSSLDADLKFHPPEIPSPKQPEKQGNNCGSCYELGKEEHANLEDIASLDLRDVPCPLNFVKAKVKLEQLKEGERMIISVDGGEPVENVTASLRKDGHTVESRQDTGGGYWRLEVIKQNKGT